MPAGGVYTLNKEERICSKKLIDKLFGGGKSSSVASFPLRAVDMTAERADGEPQAQILVSVPKRHFKRAVKRNRVKRQVREAYRLNKQILIDSLKDRQDTKVAVAFIWLDNSLHTTEKVGRSVVSLLRRISETL